MAELTKPKIDKAGNSVRDVPFTKSDIEDVDAAVYRWVRDELMIHAKTNQGFRRVPILWVSAERSYQVKHNKDLRDDNGTLILPLITIARTGMNKNPSNKGSVWGHADPVDDHKGGVITLAKKIKQDKTSNFENALANEKRSTINWPRPPSKTVYETITIPIPVYVEMTYEIGLRAEFQEQINEMQQPFYSRPGGINYVLLPGEQLRYEAFMEGENAVENTVEALGENERMYKTTVPMKVLGILIGDGVNQETPRKAKRENAVELGVDIDIESNADYVVPEDDV